MTKPAKLRDIAGVLRRIISNNLWAPRGDPDRENLYAAADAYKALKEHGWEVRGEQDIVNCLRRDNVYDEDFLAGMPDAPAVTDQE